MSLISWLNAKVAGMLPILIKFPSFDCHIIANHTLLKIKLVETYRKGVDLIQK